MLKSGFSLKSLVLCIRDRPLKTYWGAVGWGRGGGEVQLALNNIHATAFTYIIQGI